MFSNPSNPWSFHQNVLLSTWENNVLFCIWTLWSPLKEGGLSQSCHFLIFPFKKSTPPECVLQDVQLSITRIRMSCKQKLKWSLFFNFFLSKFKMPATRSGKLITFHAIKYRSIYQRCIRNHMLKEGIHENTIEALVLVEIF